jgi:FkbM family methyltransferase
MRLTKVLRSAVFRALPERLKERVRVELLGLSAGSGIDGPSMLKIRSCNGFEVAYRHGTADELILRDSFEHDILFSGIPEYQPREPDIIIDVGAHIGTFALLAASKVPRGVVHAIEACEDTFNLLRINAALNGLGNLATHHLALSDRRGTCTLYHDPGNWGHSVVRQLSDRCETAECRTLQQFFEEAGIAKCNFIKFNCEGAEFPILLSSPTDLLRRVGVMLVLYHCDLWTANSEEDLLSHLRASGFDCKVRNRTDKRGWIVAVNPAWSAAQNYELTAASS